MIQSYFGNGKGKTTAAIGAAIRCIGCDQKVLVVEFLKNNDSAEFKVMDTLENIDVLFSNEHYELFDNEKSELTPKFKDAYTKLLFEETAKISKDYQMIVLDEVLDAVEFGYIEEKAFIKLLNECKQKTEIILTGHKLPESIANVSDYISEIREINHPYNLGAPSRKGIEY
ncbi:MAG: cob(I)yrinic acid a,c-diamide adenosyltransferase [Clostridia bacterium]|nr:cob(I)yrinic acid a,c-diamide adenosyltransferase [Clostridia bacterium]